MGPYLKAEFDARKSCEKYLHSPMPGDYYIFNSKKVFDYSYRWDTFETLEWQILKLDKVENNTFYFLRNSALYKKQYAVKNANGTLKISENFYEKHNIEIFPKNEIYSFFKNKSIFVVVRNEI
jgi:hypothetical protein